MIDIKFDPDKDIPFLRKEKVNPKEKWIKHICCDGARFHILSWHGKIGIDGKVHAEIRCSEPDCIYNKPDYRRMLCNAEGHVLRPMTEKEEKKYYEYFDLTGYVPFSDEEIEEGNKEIGNDW